MRCQCFGYYLSLFVLFSTTAHALVGSTWSMTNVPPSGLTDITFPITIAEADHISGYYFAQQFQFAGLRYNLGYIGVQPRPDTYGRPVLHAVFSNFIPGTTTNNLNCHPGADGSPDGASCAFEWNGVYGRQYNFEVWTIGNNTWIGTVVDTITGVRIQIGSWTLPAGALGIQGFQVGFVEWFPWNVYRPPNHCARLPYQRTIFGNPWTTRLGSVGTQHVSYEYGDCVGRVGFQTARVGAGAVNACGWRGQTGVVEEADMMLDNEREGQRLLPQ